MALQDITKPSSQPFYTGPDPAGLITEKKYGLRYDPTTGDYVVQEYDIEYGLFGSQKVKWGNDVLYSNGTWYKIATIDGFLFDQATKEETVAATQLADKIKTAVSNSHKGAGGNAGGYVVHPSVAVRGKPSAVNGQVFNPNRTPTVVLSGPLAGLGENTLDLNFASANEQDLFGNTEPAKGLLFYPATILENQQDHLRITQYNYQAPYKDSLFPVDSNGKRKSPNAGEILLNGLQRGTVKKEKVGLPVILPIPEGISDTNQASWGPEGMNNMSAAVLATMLKNIGFTAGGLALNGALKAFTGANAMPLAAMIEIIKDLPADAKANPQVQSQITAQIASMASQQAGFDISPETILSRGHGVIPNQNLELLFNNVALRQFEFAFPFSPRSKQEAKNVRKIIRFFKQGMAARISAQGTTSDASAAASGSTSLFLGSPNVFELEYIHGPTGKHVKGLNRFKVCALTNMSVQYAAGGMYQSFEDGQPAHMVMALSFNELEPVYHSDYSRKSIAGTDSEGRQIFDDEIGF